MKRHHLLVFLVLSLCSYSATEIIRSGFDRRHTPGITPVKPMPVYDNDFQEQPKAITEGIENRESNPHTVDIPNSIKDLEFGNPAEEITTIEAPIANNMGSAVLQYPVKIPAGRLGMAPALDIQYNSDGGNNWLGLDWDLPMGAIMIETRWGVPRYDPELETETYLLNNEQLGPVTHRSSPVPRTTEKQFYPRVEKNFSKIIRHGTHPGNYWWEVIEKNGTRQFYGGSPGNGMDSSAILRDANRNIAYWALTETRDANGNFIKYRYSIVFDAGVPGGNMGSNLYPSSITYTGHGSVEGKFSIEFIRDRQLGENPRVDVSINGRWGFKQVTADLLRKINVKYEGVMIRSYDLSYIKGAFYKTLLQRISEYDAAGILFTSHEFEYFDDTKDEGAMFKPLSGIEEWTSPADSVKAGFLNPIPLFSDSASLLSGNKSFGGGFGMAITVGPFDGNLAMKTNTAGVAFGFNYSKNEGMLALIDINGDGLADKVYKKNQKLFYRPNQSGPSGAATFGEVRSIKGINDFSKGETFTGEIGLESHFVVFAGFEYTHTEDITSVYFSDVNGDQLMDIVKDGKVYFNHLDASGDPQFTTSSEATPSPIKSGSSIDPGMVQIDSLELDSAITDNPLHDVVKIWVAPQSGKISITGDVKLVQDLSQDGIDYTDDDGVRVAIQHKAAELWSTIINANDFGSKTPTGVDSVTVQKGERIYFRLQSRNNGAYDQVLWVPRITYSNHAPLLNDANGLPIFQFNADKDFLLSSNSGMGINMGGEIHITGNFTKPVTTDDVLVKVVRKSNGASTILFEQLLPWNQSANLPISILQHVLTGDALFFSVSSQTNIDWSALQWSPFVYFRTSTNPAITQLYDNLNNPLYYSYPIVDFQSFNRRIQPNIPWIAPSSDTFTIRANPDLNPTLMNGEITFSIKKKNQLLATHLLPVTLGVVGSHPEIKLILTTGDSLYFEYHTRNQLIADLIDTPYTEVDANPGDAENFVSGLFTLDTSFLFGPLYRHWGQFAYNGNRERANLPLNESYLQLDGSLTDQTPPTIDLSTASSIDQMQTMFDAAGGNKPKDDQFIYLLPNNERKYWIGYDNLTYIKKDTISSSRMGKDNLTPVNPVMDPSPGTATGAVGINKVSNTDNFAFAVGLGINLSASFGFTRFLYDFTDLNGDRFPDILSTNKIQYSTPQGGLETGVRNFSFGEVIKAEHFSVGASLGGTFLKSNASNAKATPKGSKADKAASQSGISAGITGNFNYNRDSTAFAWMDINADDLPDRVYKDGTVALNIGYSFLPAEQWGFTGINEGDAISYGAGFGINIGNYSISAGIGLTRSENQTHKTLQDMNGDGLLDYVLQGTPIKVAINKGNGFAIPIAWTGADAIHKGTSTGESINGAFTVGIPIIPIAPVVKLCLNPSFNISQGSDRTGVQFEDINGDGYPDFLRSNEDNKLSVFRSTIDRTNKLRKVDRPLGASFVLNYERTGNTYQMPNSIWALSSVKIYDGVNGDGADSTLQTFEYGEGKFDRNEREFNGFGKIITNHHDTEHGNEVYRKIEETYINDNFYEKGLLKSKVIKDKDGKKYNEKVYSYLLKNIQDGSTLPNSFKKTDDGIAFPALTMVESFFYEGQSNPGKSTSSTYSYDLYGNVVLATDLGDVGTDDDNSTHTSYHLITSSYIVNIPSFITVMGSGQVFRQQASIIDNATGNIIETQQILESGEVAKRNMEYDVFGNLVKLINPQNEAGQRLSHINQYDDEVHTYNTRVTDSYGYTTETIFDVRFGKALSTTDVNGQKTVFTLDQVGRISTMTGPLELAAGIPFTIAFEYHPEAAVPWALAKHYDPAHPTNFIETAMFIDGLGRELQTKKDGALFMGAQMPDQEIMIVSGEDQFDAFGRTIEVFHPTTEPKGSTGILNTNEDSIRSTRSTYDVLDRVRTITLPDLSTSSNEYDFGTDRNGNIQFKTTVTDGNGIWFEKFTNVRGLLKSTRAQNRQGTNVQTSYQYNAVDELIKVIDDRGNTIVSTYDRLGRRTSVRHPDAGVTTYHYDLNDNHTQVIAANRSGNTGIKYSYDHERLVKIVYPQNPQNNVMITYGAPGSDYYRSGRVIKQQDASGTQELFYDRQGATVKNTRTINVPGTTPLIFHTEWTYDTWNRLTGMIYPDGERLAYRYNVGGQLESMEGIKGTTTYNYVRKLGYDKFQQKVFVQYGNYTEMTYDFEPGRRRLSKMTASTATDRKMLDNNYTYDREFNILNIVNDAPIPPSNLMGGKYRYDYSYDDLYRLTNARGSFSGSSHEHRFEVSMTYDNLFNILTKSQVHERKGYDETTWTLRNQTSHNLNYDYDQAIKPHAPKRIGARTLTYDANGNQTRSEHTVSAQNRKMVWDEEDRIKSLSDNGEIFNYTYDGAGSRVLKSNGQGESISINGKPIKQATGIGNYTVYVNPYYVLRSGGFTKHFFIESRRVASKLGESGNGNGGNNNGGTGSGNGNNQEAFQFFYHPDHLGNNSFITDRSGEVYQHLEYFPSGEAFIEEHGNQERTPYLYNDKELDEETGLYYYGARYYDLRSALWPSVDELWELPDEVNKSPYVYVINNPITFGDLDGRGKINKSLELVFYVDKKYNIAEYVRQLKGQEIGLRKLTAKVYRVNRAAYKAKGRSTRGAYLQKVYRKVNGLLAHEAALHNPDQIAGGGEQPTDRGDLQINSSIGSQWRTIVSDLDKYVSTLKPKEKIKVNLKAKKRK